MNLSPSEKERRYIKRKMFWWNIRHPWHTLEATRVTLSFSNMPLWPRWRWGKRNGSNDAIDFEFLCVIVRMGVYGNADEWRARDGRG